jgi:hypothetical protein
MPQKVRGFIVGFTWVRGIATIKKYSYGDRKSRQIFANVKDFQTLIAFNSIQTRGAKGECKQAISKSRTQTVNEIHS